MPEKAMPDWLTPPDDTPDYMFEAWASCLSWACEKPEILADFTAATSTPLPITPQSRFERMIDEATGYKPAEEFMRTFVPWFNEWVWGSMSGGEDV